MRRVDSAIVVVVIDNVLLAKSLEQYLIRILCLIKGLIQNTVLLNATWIVRNFRLVKAPPIGFFKTNALVLSSFFDLEPL